MRCAHCWAQRRSAGTECSCPRSHAALRLDRPARRPEEACSSLSSAWWSARLRSACFRGQAAATAFALRWPACCACWRSWRPPWLGARPMARPDSMARPAARSDIRSDPHPGADRLPPLEIELKLAVPKAAGQALRQRLEAYGSQPALPVDSVYFDTGDRRLASQRAALRVRRVDAPRPHWVQTFKTNDAPAALSQRGEWETQVQGPRLDRPSLSRSPLLQMLGDRPGRLAPVFRTRFERTVREVQYNGARIELALDEGEIVAGRRKEPIREIELELCDGASSALFGLALDLVGRGRDALALVPSIDSKAARGYRLAQHAGPHPISAGPDGFAGLLQPQLSTAEAARRVVPHGVYPALAHMQGAAVGEDPEYVHQAPVPL